MRKDANILSCEMASLTVKKVSWGEDAFCVHDEIFMQFGKKSGEQANVIFKKKLVVLASLFFYFPFFSSWNFLWGELPHCTKLLFLHAFTFTTHATASIWLPRFTRTFFLYLGDSDKWKNLLMNGKSMFWQVKQVDLRCRYPLAEGQKTLRMMTTPFLFLCL